MAQEELHSLLSFLPPTPWHAYGNKILAGDTPIGFVVCKNASFTANALAQLLNRYADVERENIALRRALAEAQDAAGEG